MRATYRRTQGISGSSLLVSEMFAKEGFVAAFTTRRGGWSPRPYNGLNMGFGVPDDPVNVRRNRREALCALGLDPDLAAAMRQVHGTRIVEVTEGLAGKGGLDHTLAFAACDALHSAVSGLALIATYADCVPVVIADLKTRRIGVAHAGWKGTAAGIAKALAVEMGIDRRGAENFMASIGPSICRECYEVGEDVASLLERAPGGAEAVQRSSDKTRADLAGMNEAQLRMLGIPAGRIERHQGCTFEEADEFFSHRRDNGFTGRGAAIAAIATGGI